MIQRGDWSMSSKDYLPKRTSLIVGIIIAALIVAGGVTILVLRPVTDPASLYIAAAAVILSPIFVLIAYLVNRKGQ